MFVLKFVCVRFFYDKGDGHLCASSVDTFFIFSFLIDFLHEENFEIHESDLIPPTSSPTHTHTHTHTHTDTDTDINRPIYMNMRINMIVLILSFLFPSDPTPPIPFILGTALPPSPVVIAVPDLVFCSRTLTALSNQGLSSECLLLLEEMR